MPNPRKVGSTPLLYEPDGDLNLGWVFGGFALFVAVLVIGIYMGMFIATGNGGIGWFGVLTVILTFLLCVMLLSGVMVMSLQKAKLVSPALTRAAGGLAKGDASEPPPEYLYEDESG